jgi:hypothetical protein
MQGNKRMHASYNVFQAPKRVHRVSNRIPFTQSCRFYYSDFIFNEEQSGTGGT